MVLGALHAPDHVHNVVSGRSNTVKPLTRTLYTKREMITQVPFVEQCHISRTVNEARKPFGLPQHRTCFAKPVAFAIDAAAGDLTHGPPVSR